MQVWALADLHLAFGAPEKDMCVFGPPWEGYAEKIATQWQAHVQPEDLILLPGDLSWAKDLETARIDLQWIGNLPGTKLLLRGNHDYWWKSASQIRAVLPPGMHILQNDVFLWQGVAVAGSRLWDTAAYSFDAYIVKNERAEGISQPFSPLSPAEKEAQEKIYCRELERLERSLALLPTTAVRKIAMTHYPPIGADLLPSAASLLFERYGVSDVVFGHLHSVDSQKPLFGEARGIRYTLVAADYRDFIPFLVCTLS